MTYVPSLSDAGGGGAAAQLRRLKGQFNRFHIYAFIKTLLNGPILYKVVVTSVF